MTTPLSIQKETAMNSEVVEANLRRIAENWSERTETGRLARQALASLTEGGGAPFQARVQPWMMACFGAEIAADRVERGDRLLEEVLELLRSGGYDPARVVALRDYVWGRPPGEPAQEVGGVMITLAAYCLAHSLDMHEAGETELARIWTKVEAIRAKQAAKPTGSALPIPSGTGECSDCHGPNPVWFAPNDLWNLVMGGPEARGDPGGIVCPVCFTRRAEKAGIIPTAWVLQQEGRPLLLPDREGVAIKVCQFECDHEALDWPEDKCRELLSYIDKPHSGDCTKDPWTCMRCAAEDCYRLTDAILSLLGGVHAE